MLETDRVTVEEGYVSACNADDMTVVAEARRPPDYLIASGMTRNMLGGALMRLHSEWSGMNRRGMSATDAILLVDQLKTLPTVRTALHSWLVQRGHDGADMRLTHQVIAHWLDDVCGACQGRGYDLIPGTPMTGRQCKKCNGTGRRRPPSGDLVREALNMMDTCVMGHRTAMKKRLRAMR